MIYDLQKLAEDELNSSSETSSVVELDETYQTRFNRVLELRNAMNCAFYEREELTTCQFVSLIAAENMAVVGLAGTGKSMGIRTIASNLQNSEMFEFICDKFTKPADLLGAVSIPDMKAGIDRIRIDGKMGTCHLSFLDEGFKLNGATLNGLLGVLNDKRVWNGTGYTASPMISCIVASNEYPTSKELGALWDRFPLRFHVDPITSDDNFRRLIFDSQQVNSPIQLEDIYALQAEVDNCNFSPSAFDVLLELRAEIKALRIYISDRRWKKSIKILKAYSILEGKDCVDRESFNILKHMLWDKPQQRQKVWEIIDNLPEFKSEEDREKDLLNQKVKALLDICQANSYSEFISSEEDNISNLLAEEKLEDEDRQLIQDSISNKFQNFFQEKIQQTILGASKLKNPQKRIMFLCSEVQNLTTDLQTEEARLTVWNCDSQYQNFLSSLSGLLQKFKG